MIRNRNETNYGIMRRYSLATTAVAALSVVLCVECLTIPSTIKLRNHPTTAAALSALPHLRQSRGGEIINGKSRRIAGRRIVVRMSSSTDYIDSLSSDRSEFLDDVDGIGNVTTVETAESSSNTTAATEEETSSEIITEEQQQQQQPQVDGGILSSIDDAQLLDTSIFIEEVFPNAPTTDPSSLNLQQQPPPEPQPPTTLQPTPPPQITAPTLRQILSFAIPAIGVWLCSPLLSLIDTSSVGLLSGTAQQAALNPAVAVTDYGCLLVAFMYTATTNLIATVQESDTEVGKPKTAGMLISAMQISTYVGAALSAVLLVFARPLLRGIIGNDAIDPEVFAAAMRYVRIRALGMPAAVVIGSAQSACLGMKDVRSPLYVLFAAAVVNFCGDVLFVGRDGAWVGGAAGAAWATVFSQYAALGMFVKWLTTARKSKKKEVKEEKVVNLTNSILELMGEEENGEQRRMRLKKSLQDLSSSEEKVATSESSKPTSTTSTPTSSTKNKKKKKENFSTQGFLAGRFSFRKLLHFPTRKDVKVFQPYFLPVTTTQVGRVSSYIAMSHVVSSALGTTCMAANQIIVSFFYCLTPIADSLNLTAQSFIPGIFEKKRSAARAAALKKAKNNFLKAGLVFGVVMSALVGMMPLLCRFFTSDVSVLAEVSSAVSTMVLIFIVHGVICAAEGVLLGQKDLGFLGKAYASYFFAVPYFMLRVKKAALSGAANIGLNSVWKVFMLYQFFRASLWMIRLSQLQRRSENALVVEESE